MKLIVLDMKHIIPIDPKIIFYIFVLVEYLKFYHSVHLKLQLFLFVYKNNFIIYGYIYNSIPYTCLVYCAI